MISKAYRAGKLYLKPLLALQPHRTVQSLALAVTVGLLSGVGVLLLLPMLQLVGLPSESANEHIVVQFVQRLFLSLDVPLTLTTVLAAFVVVNCSQTILVYRHAILNAELLHELIESLRNRLFKSITNSDWTFFVSHRSSDLNHALSYELNRVAGGTMCLLGLASSVAIAAVYLTLSLLVSPAISLIGLGTLLLFWPILRGQNQAVYDAGQQVSKTTLTFWAKLSEFLAGMKEAKGMGWQHRMTEEFQVFNSDMKDAQIDHMRASAKTKLAYGFGSSVIVSLLVYLSFGVLQRPVGEVALLVVIFARLTPLMRDIHGKYQTLLFSVPAMQSTMDLDSRCENLQESTVASEQREFKHALVAQSVWFRHDSSQDKWALRDVSFTIDAGSMTAIVGLSGAGKTTLGDLLMGLLRPEQGEIVIDDRPLASDHLMAWRQSIGYVPQETFLLHDTIRANLLWANPHATEEEIWQALRLAAADSFVRNASRQLDTEVGDRGIRLSGGERQRLALARALLRQPTILVLDEATSSLDAENERAIQESIERMKHKLTVVVIAHRLSTIRAADQILVLDNGKLVETGTYEELAGRNEGRFQKLLAYDSIASNAA